MTDEKSALIAMSGGVDSSVAAYLMNKAGFRCMGTTMRLYRGENTEMPDVGCSSQKDIDDARAVAESLEIPFCVLDFEPDFKKQIVDKFIRTYEAGGTPNPCVDCNRCMKFARLLDFAKEQGLYYLITGHYARIERRDDGQFLLKKAEDPNKDQSYVLYTLTQEQLAHILFPLGEFSKSEARSIADKNGFVNSDKPDSQDICFVPDGDYVKFMERYTGKVYPDGEFLDADGKCVGRHAGAVRYTIGQRKGLGISMGEPVYVFEKNMEQNTVSVGKESLLFHRELVADEVNLISVRFSDLPIRCKAKTRYRQTEQDATVYSAENGRIKVVFDEPQRAMTVGQSVVLYDGDTVVGGGTIVSVGD